MKKYIASIGAVACAAAMASCASHSSAENATSASTFPTHPITVIVPQAPGSVSDVLARTLAQPLGKILHESVVVKNLPGGSTSVGIAAMESAPADGYTLFFPSQSMEYGIAQKFTPYGTKNMTFLARLVEYPMGIYVSSKSRFKTLSDLVQYAKAHPNAVSFSASGAVSSGQEIVAKLEAAEHIKVTYVATKGGNKAALAVLSGQSSAGAGVLGNALQYVRAGKMRIIYLSSNSQNSFFPNVPNASSLHVNDVVSNWFGVVVKAGTPMSIRAKLAAAIKKATENSRWQSLLKSKAISSAWLSSAAFQTSVSREMPTIINYVKASASSKG